MAEPGIDVLIVTANVPKPPLTSLPLPVETTLLPQRREEATGRVDCGRELENDRTFKQAVDSSDRLPSLKTVGLLKLTSRSSTVLKNKTYSAGVCSSAFHSDGGHWPHWQANPRAMSKSGWRDANYSAQVGRAPQSNCIIPDQPYLFSQRNLEIYESRENPPKKPG
jgi:hypothetical protein